MSFWRRARSFFPVAEDAIFLDHAGGGPISSRVDEAVRAVSDDAAHRVGATQSTRRARDLERIRTRSARLLRAEPNEIAFVSHAAAGLAEVGSDIDWERGDRVIATDDADLQTWRALQSRGVETLLVPAGTDGPSPERLEEALLHPRARLLALPAVHPVTGARAPLETIGRSCRQRGVLLCVDASHALGCLDLDVGACAIDYLVSDAHRFLMALAGSAVLYRGRSIARDGLDAAGRFESGPTNHVGLAALGAAVDLTLEIGPAQIESRVLSLTERLSAGLDVRRIPLLSPRGAAASGIVTFDLSGESSERTTRRLRDGRLYLADVGRGVRASPHFYNDEAEIDALLEAL